MRETEYTTDSGETVLVEYAYDPGEPEVWTEPNGDPGTPGTGPSVDIYHVWYSATDRLGNIISVDVQNLIEDNIEDKILEDHEE